MSFHPTVMHNPYLPSWEYVPDGEPHVFEGRVYVYGSHDQFRGFVYCMNDYVCWSAPVENLGDWRYEGVIYKKDAGPLKPGRRGYAVRAGRDRRPGRAVLPLLRPEQPFRHLRRRERQAGWPLCVLRPRALCGRHAARRPRDRRPSVRPRRFDGGGPHHLYTGGVCFPHEKKARRRHVAPSWGRTCSP